MLEMARVVAIHPEDHSVDLLILRTNQRAAGVPVLTSSASTTSGTSNLPTVTPPAGADPFLPPRHAAVAAICFVAPTAGGNWVVVGWKFPEQNGVLNAEPGRQVTRHSSGAWQMIAPDGTMTMGHPSGAVFVMGPTLEPVNPVGGGVDAQWQHNQPSASVPCGMTARFPSGARIDVAGDGKVTVTAPAEVAFVVPLAKFSGNVEVAGEVRATGDVLAGNIRLKTHRHTGVAGGSATSGGPVA